MPYGIIEDLPGKVERQQLNDIGDSEQQNPGDQDGNAEGNVGIDVTGPADVGPVDSFVRFVREKPHDGEIDHKEQQEYE